jgi:hypothetical protein
VGESEILCGFVNNTAPLNGENLIKGIAKVRLQNGSICNAEIHWYEAHGIGRKKFKIKRLLD